MACLEISIDNLIEEWTARTDNGFVHLVLFVTRSNGQIWEPSCLEQTTNLSDADDDRLCTRLEKLDSKALALGSTAVLIPWGSMLLLKCWSDQGGRLGNEWSRVTVKFVETASNNTDMTVIKSWRRQTHAGSLVLECVDSSIRACTTTQNRRGTESSNGMTHLREEEDRPYQYRSQTNLPARFGLKQPHQHSIYRARTDLQLQSQASNEAQ